MDLIQLPKWSLRFRNPDDNEYVIGNWAATTITENFNQASMTLVLPASRPELQYVTDLVTDVTIYRGSELMYRLRILDSEDTFTRDGHGVQFTCSSYEAVLKRRILYSDFEEDGDQHDLAWLLIETTQNRQTLNLTRAVDSGASGTLRSRVIGKGATVTEAIDNIGSMAGGFDWWIDANLEVHFQTPRRLLELNEDWKWGAEVATIQRQSFADQYAASVMLVGALQEVVIPGGGTYPPPDPVIKEIDDMTLGRWETTYSYPDVVTNASLDSKADWHLGQSAIFRPNYTIELEPGAWKTTVRPGTTASLRIAAFPRLNIRVPIRVEELQIAISPDGAETVTVAVKAEEPETDLGSFPLVINTAVNTPPVGAVIVVTPVTDGATRVSSRVSPVNQLASVITNLALRLTRRERTQ